MEAECPNDHTENLSWSELAERLNNDDFECREEDCSKKLSYKIDERFWKRFDGTLFSKRVQS